MLNYHFLCKQTGSGRIQDISDISVAAPAHPRAPAAAGQTAAAAHLETVPPSKHLLMADNKQDSSSLRQALAIAIVRNKRRCDQEATEWRAKSQKLEAALQEQQAKEAQLKAWVRTVMPQQGSDTPHAACSTLQADGLQLEQTTVFLPPLAATANNLHMQPAGTNFQALMQQLVVAAAAAGETYSSVADVLDGKAAALSSMLLTNLQVMQQVSGPSSSSNSLTQGQAPDLVSAISSFVTSTLLHAPRSSLSTAYMKQSAACLAAALAPPATPPTATAVTQHAQQDQSEADSSLAVQVVQLMQQLLQLRAAAGSEGATATAMLQQLSLFPSTSLLLCLAAVQQLQQRMQELQEANAAVMHVTLANLATTAQAGQQALVTASHCFQASHDLLADLVSADTAGALAWITS